jgi:DNA-binding transcriptional ArsR family regulator
MLKQTDQLDKAFHALADATRRGILDRLSKGPASVSELARPEPDRRMIYAYDFHHSGHFHSVTLSSLFLQPEASRTHLSYTEQIVFIDGRYGTSDRQHGTDLMFARIVDTLGVKEGAQ